MLKDAITKEKLIFYAQAQKKKRAKPGIDNMSADTALLWLEINGDVLIRQLLRGEYQPMPINGFSIASSSGKPRTVGKLTIIDTVIQKCLLEYIDSVADSSFSPRCMAYRKDKRLSDAISLYCTLGSKYRFAVKADPASCFDNIDFEILREKLFKLLGDEPLTDCIMSFVKAPIVVDNEFIQREKGLPQGAVLSSVLCNIYLSSLDTLLESTNTEFIRYSDDIVAFADSLEQAEDIFASISSHLENNLNLKLNRQKSRISSPCDITFLGHTFEKKHSSLVAFQKPDNNLTSFHTWSNSPPKNTSRTINIVTDGILRQKDYSLRFDTNEESTDIPIKETDVINIYSDVVFDTGALCKAFKSGTVINVFSNDNNLLGRFIPSEGLRAPSVIFEQLQAYYNEDARVNLAKAFLLASFHNTRLVIRYYNKQNANSIYTRALYNIDKLYEKIIECDNYERLLMLEAKGREWYYGCFDSFLEKSDFSFEKRSKRPPKNEINALLSFGNTLLYSYIATEINKTSLDVRVGYLHATNKRKESLNLDLAEIFKPLIVDRTIFALVNRGAITKEDFENKNGGTYLNTDGKKKFIRALNEKLDTTLDIKGQSFSYRRIIQNEIQSLIRFFRNSEKYKPFKQVR